MNLITVIWILIFLSWTFFLVRNFYLFKTRYASRIFIYVAGLSLSYICFVTTNAIPVLPWEKTTVESQIQSELKRVSQDLGAKLQRLDMEIYEPISLFKKQLEFNLKEERDDQRIQEIIQEFAQKYNVSVLLYDGHQKFHSTEWPFLSKDWGLQLAYSLALSRTSQKVITTAPISKELVQETLKTSYFHTTFLRQFFDKPDEMHFVPGKMFGDYVESAFWTFLLDDSKKFHFLLITIPPSAMLEILRRKLNSTEKWTSRIGQISATITKVEENEIKESFDPAGKKFRFQTNLLGFNGYLLVLEVDSAVFSDRQWIMTFSALMILLLLPFLIELFALILTFRLTKIFEIFRQNSDPSQKIFIPQGYQQEFELALHAKILKKLRAIQAVTKIRDLIAWQKRKVDREGYLADDSLIPSEEKQPEGNRSQIIFYLGLFFLYAMGLMVGFLIVAYLDYDQNKKEWEKLLISRDQILSQVDRTGSNNLNRDLLRKVQISLRPYLANLESILKDSNLTHKLEAKPLPLKDNAAILLSYKQKEIYFEGKDFIKELGSNWKRMYLLGIRHGDIYFHKFSTPLYSYPLDSSEFFKSRNKFEILSNRGTHFLKFFYQDKDHAILLLVKLNTIPPEDLKQTLLKHLIRLEPKVSLSENDILRWNQRSINRGYRQFGLIYETNFDPIYDFLIKLNWAHVFFLCLLLFLKIQGGANLFRLKREIRFFLNALLFLSVLFYFYFLYDEAQGSYQEIYFQDQMFQQREIVINEVRHQLQNTFQNIQKQIQNWSTDYQTKPFPFPSQAGYILFSKSGVIQQNYDGLDPFESRLMIGLALNLLDQYAPKPNFDLFSLCKPPQIVWTLKHMDNAERARKLSQDLISKLRLTNRIASSVANTPAGPMLLVISAPEEGHDSSILISAIPERNLASCLQDSDLFPSSMNLKLKETGLLLGILDLQESSLIFSNDWSSMPADLNAFLRSGVGDPSPWDNQESKSIWRYEILPSGISKQFRILTAWKDGGRTPYETTIFPIGFLVASLVFLTILGVLLGINRSMTKPLQWIKDSLDNLLSGYPPADPPKKIFGECSLLVSTFSTFLKGLERAKLPSLPQADLLKLVELNSLEKSAITLQAAIMEVRVHWKNLTENNHNLHISCVPEELQSTLGSLVEEASGMVFRLNNNRFIAVFSSESINQGSQSGIEIGLKISQLMKTHSKHLKSKSIPSLQVILQEAQIQLEFNNGDQFNWVELNSVALRENQSLIERYNGSLEGVFITKPLASKFQFLYDLSPLADNEDFIEVLPS